MLFFIGQIFPYLAAGIFIVGMIWRVGTWLRVPVPFQLTLSPAPITMSGRIWTVGKELLLFSSLWRGDRGLWLWAWLMHVTLAMVIVGHIVGISQIGLQFTAMGFTASQSLALSAFMGTSTGIVMLAALCVLLYRRTAVPEVKRLSDPADYFDLLLILAIVVSGMHMRTTSLDVDLMAIRTYLGGIITFHPTPIPKDWIFVSHFFLVNVLLIYIPFSKLVHLAGSFVNRTMLVAAPPVYPSPHTSSTTSTSSQVQLWKGGNSQ
ncbi:MAG: respiratory nitrate reductase subunit gamma [Sporomusaceae bacterium]|nr:respiratory nitrate reductase subunit gamma [Sporomusaceae bacterium]